MDTGLCVLPVRGPPVLLSMLVLPYRESAEAAARLFSLHVGTMPGFDFFPRCIVGFGSRHSRCGPPPILRDSPNSYQAPTLDIRACLAVSNTAEHAIRCFIKENYEEERSAVVHASVQGKAEMGNAYVKMTKLVVALGPDETEVTVVADLTVTGILAQLGRGMMQHVSKEVFKEFIEVLGKQLT